MSNITNYWRIIAIQEHNKNFCADSLDGEFHLKANPKRTAADHYQKYQKTDTWFKMSIWKVLEIVNCCSLCDLFAEFVICLHVCHFGWFLYCNVGPAKLECYDHVHCWESCLDNSTWWGHFLKFYLFYWW